MEINGNDLWYKNTYNQNKIRYDALICYLIRPKWTKNKKQEKYTAYLF